MNKKSLKNILVTILLFAVIGSVFTALTALCPQLPFILEDSGDLQPVGFGFPLKFVEQTLDEDTLKEYSSLTYKYTIMPRYDKYDTHIVIWKVLVSVIINSAVIWFIYFAFSKMPKLCRKVLLYIFIGVMITLLSAIVPVSPGTFTVNDLEPMHFGWPVKFVEQTSDGSILTYEYADEYLAQSYIAPNYGVYETHIVVWKCVANILLSAFIVAAAFNLIKLLVLYLKGGTAKIRKHYSDKYLTLLPKDELAKRLKEKEAEEAAKLPKKRFKTLD